MVDNTLNYNILIDVDTLFDTRLPIVYAIDRDTVIKELELNKYHTRKKDVFGIISNDIFKAFYNNRDKDILLLSTPTGMFDMLREYCIEARATSKIVGNEKPIEIFLNTYPYRLDSDEVDNLSLVLRQHVKDVIVTTIYKSTEDLTPSWVSDNVGTIIKYDAIDWLEFHMAYSNIINTPLIDTILVGPAIATGEILNKDIDYEVFKNIMLSASAFITLTLIRPDYFSTKK